MLCFRKFPVANKITEEEGWGGGVIKIFRRKFFCHRVPKNFVGKHFCAVFQKNSASEKDYG